MPRVAGTAEGVDEKIMATLWQFAMLPVLGVTTALSWMIGRRSGNPVSRVGMSNELSLLIDGATNHAIYMLDAEGRVTIWNKGAERIKGWSETEVLGRHTAIFYSQADVDSGKPARDLALAKANGRLEEESWRVRRDGSGFLASVTITALTDGLGRHVGFGKVVHDVTVQKAIEGAIEAREMQLRSILATVPDAMVVMDDKGIVSSFSATAERLFGYAEEEVIGWNVNLLMPAPDRGAHDDHILRYLDSSEHRIIDTTRRVFGRRRDGSTFPLELAVGEAIGGGRRVFTGFIRDLSAKEEADARLAALQTELGHISRLSAMGTMASTLAHELNQPIAAVANYVEASIDLLGDETDGPTLLLKQALKDAAAEAFRAGSIVRRLRAFVARGEVEKRIEPIAPLIDDAAALGLSDAAERGIAAHVHLSPGAGPVLADRVQVQQVLVNILRNAVEAMPEGGALTIDAANEGGFVHFVVSDDGPGLSGDVRDRLFEAFASTKREGMGLGLSICRTIVEAHGGRIWTTSPQGGGTEFHFTLPRAETEEMA